MNNTKSKKSNQLTGFLMGHRYDISMFKIVSALTDVIIN
jgi:hypothetical protein